MNSIKNLFKKFRKNASEKMDEELTALELIKNKRSWTSQLNDILTLILIAMLILTWQWTLPKLNKIDQLKNDLKEQVQVIEMEKQNNLSLESLAKDKESLHSNIEKIYTAIPHTNEEVEGMISMLEDMATQNHMLIDAIGIRMVPMSQINHDQLIGFVGIYEYSFTLEGQLPNILTFINAMNSSLRIMDLMSLEIEENEGTYRANLVTYAYHLTDQ